jgi:hypothetical protein
MKKLLLGLALVAAAPALLLVNSTTARAEGRPGPLQIEYVPVAFHYEYTTVFVSQPRFQVVFETVYDDDGLPFTVRKTITRFVRVPVTTRVKVYDR